MSNFPHITQEMVNKAAELDDGLRNIPEWFSSTYPNGVNMLDIVDKFCNPKHPDYFCEKINWEKGYNFQLMLSLNSILNYTTESLKPAIYIPDVSEETRKYSEIIVYGGNNGDVVNLDVPDGYGRVICFGHVVFGELKSNCPILGHVISTDPNSSQNFIRLNSNLNAGIFSTTKDTVLITKRVINVGTLHLDGTVVYGKNIHAINGITINDSKVKLSSIVTAGKIEMKDSEVTTKILNLLNDKSNLTLENSRFEYAYCSTQDIDATIDDKSTFSKVKEDKASEGISKAYYHLV